MSKQNEMRAYIPQQVIERLNEDFSQMWDNGVVARMLILTGIPVIQVETIPTICYRINMINQSEVQEKLAMGMPIDEVHIPEVITPELLRPYIGAAVSNLPFVVLSDAAFSSKLVTCLKVLPTADIISMSVTQNESMRQADAELNEGR